MTRSRYVASQRLRGAVVTTVYAVSILLSGRTVYVQSGADSATIRAGDVNLHSSGSLFGLTRGSGIAAVLRGAEGMAEEPPSSRLRNNRRQWAARGPGASVFSNATRAAAVQASSGGRQRSIGRKVAGGVIGAVGGFFAGGFLGAAIEGDRCECDDPGLVGFLIGAPTGAVIGGIVGFKLF